MPAPKGHRIPNAPKGRKKGVPNKVTQEFRDTVQKLLDDNRDNVSLWLKQTAEVDPSKALDLVSKLAEYAAPKLARTELTGKDGGPMTLVQALPGDANL
jgi:hypothetical protein